MVDDTVDGKDNLEEKTGEVAKIRIYHVTWIFFNLDVEMKVGGQRHCGWQGQPGGEDQGGLQNQDVSPQLGFSSSRM